MARQKATTVYVADFETTVDTIPEQQTSTEVWASAIVEIGTENVIIDNSIEGFFTTLNKLAGRGKIKVGFHNLKFDGSFILDWLCKNGYEPAIIEEDGISRWAKEDEMWGKTFTCLISNMGQWYQLTVCEKSRTIFRFFDTLKLLPFSVANLSKAFDTKYKKLEMEYIGERHAGGEITEEEKAYIRNDVLVVAEALYKMYQQGHNKLTIARCAKDEYLLTVKDKFDLESIFPNIAKLSVPNEDMSIDAFIRKSYKGGWCYLMPNKANKTYSKGITADVNSLYPSMMNSDRIYPVGLPTYFKGSIPKIEPREYFFVHFKCRFNIKPNMLPTVQIKGSSFYKHTEWLTTSDILYNGKYVDKYVNLDGELVKAEVELTMTQTDYYLFLKHYDVTDLHIIDGFVFKTMLGKVLFGDYVNKFAEMKKNATDKTTRTIAKLFLNSLYGRFATKIDATNKSPYMDEYGKLHFEFMEAEDINKAWYIPIGAAITAYAREFTITAAQNNYDNFIYADTDSIHCNCKPKDIQGITIHKYNFSCWKLEATWDEAIFVRQKTYIEHVVEEDLEPCTPYYNIKCAGMDKRPKQLLKAKLEHTEIEIKNDNEEVFMNRDFTLADYKIGLRIPGKLITRRLPGGILLVPSTYEMR